MKPSVYRRDTCRLCASRELTLVLGLTPTPPVDAFVPASKLGETQESYPLDLFLCRDCGHAQLLDVVRPDILFGNYIYETSSSPGLVEHFRQYASEVFELIGLAAGTLAVDVGSNDGTLLGFFKQRGMRVLGVDPAREVARRATERGIETIPEFFTCEMGRKVRQKYGPAGIVTANNVFAHADDLGDMAEGIRELLAPDGVFVFEVSYLLDMIRGMVFDFIYHEHLSHHSVKPLRRFLASHGMALIDVIPVPTKGGSLRCVAQLCDGPRRVSPVVASMVAAEDDVGLDRPEIFRDYAARIEHARKQVQELVQDLTRRGKTIAGYGASATSTVLIHHFNLGGVLSCIVEDNPTRQGLYSPGHHIPVVSSDALYETKPDYVLALAWRFSDMMMRKHPRYREQGGRFIVPLPEIQVV